MIAHPNSNRWQSLGGVYSAKTRSPLVQIARIEGQSFGSKEAALQHGIELAKRWVDEQGSTANIFGYGDGNHVWTIHRFIRVPRNKGAKKQIFCGIDFLPERPQTASSSP